MSFATSLNALADVIDPGLAYWSVLLLNGKRYSEHSLIPTLIAGQRGVRKLDWALDLVSTGDIYRVKELTLHCPDGRKATLEMTTPTENRSLYTAFQFKTKCLNMMGASGIDLEFIVIGRVLDKASGACECFAWDYRPLPGGESLVAYKTSIYHFGAWRDNITPITALGIDVQGFRL